MLPKTEKELELYFMLSEMQYSLTKSKENYAYMNVSVKANHLRRYNELKAEYLNKLSEINS